MGFVAHQSIDAAFSQAFQDSLRKTWDQVDLPDKRSSGLNDALRILAKVPGISITHFAASDVVRHPIVQHVVEAYEAASNVARNA